jgi:hypothetical protein
MEGNQTNWQKCSAGAGRNVVQGRKSTGKNGTVKTGPLGPERSEALHLIARKRI